LIKKKKSIYHKRFHKHPVQKPLLFGGFFPKIFQKKKAFLGVAAVICFFSFWQNVAPKKMASQESGEVFFKGIFLM
jgi:hypothetical protein